MQNTGWCPGAGLTAKSSLFVNQIGLSSIKSCGGSYEQKSIAFKKITMANKVKTPKSDMGGNRYGGRWEMTEVLKDQSKTARRRAELAEVHQQLADVQAPCLPKTGLHRLQLVSLDTASVNSQTSNSS